MAYDADFWNRFTEESESRYNEEFAKFIRDLAFSLKANSILEIGCNTGNDLRLFPENFEVYGIDLNENALEKARKKLPSFKFKNNSITELPFDDSSIDFVFTHFVLNYVPEQYVSQALDEMFRVSKKYIVNCELYNENESTIKDEKTNSWYRNMLKRWSNFRVKIISNVDMHKEIDPRKSRFVLVRKV